MEHADKLGYSEAWIGEHFTLPWENMPSPELFIAGALGVTKQKAFGPEVSLLHYHEPAHVAHRIAMLDHMARGRIYFGIGSRGAPTDTEMFDTDLSAGSLCERRMTPLKSSSRCGKASPLNTTRGFLRPGHLRLNPTLGWAFT